MTIIIQVLFSADLKKFQNMQPSAEVKSESSLSQKVLMANAFTIISATIGKFIG
jgi:hypothetical protein